MTANPVPRERSEDRPAIGWDAALSAQAGGLSETEAKWVAVAANVASVVSAVVTRLVDAGLLAPEDAETGEPDLVVGALECALARAAEVEELKAALKRLLDEACAYAPRRTLGPLNDALLDARRLTEHGTED